MDKHQFSKENAFKKKFRYYGISMLPTFKPGDILYIRPKVNGLKPGDIVVYLKENEYTVHRVCAIKLNLVYTRGDNNPYEDPTPISITKIIGVVEKVGNLTALRPVVGGDKGLRQARFRWWVHGLRRKLLPWLGAPYRWLKKKGWVAKVWHPQVTVIRFKTPGGILLKYKANEKVIATWQPEISCFRCKRPYDLVLKPPQDSPQ